MMDGLKVIQKEKKIKEAKIGGRRLGGIKISDTASI